jgi:hypothetical protein
MALEITRQSVVDVVEPLGSHPFSSEFLKNLTEPQNFLRPLLTFCERDYDQFIKHETKDI